MASRPPRRRTGDPELDRRLLEILGDRAGNPEDRDLLFEMLATVVRMAGDGVDRLNLKITNAALKEMRQAFRVFAPFRDVPKVTIFGSARTRPDDPLYRQACELAATLARQDWMVVTGAGPGIMAAGAQGAGPDRSIGVNIRLPFEDVNPFIATDPKLVSMKYFFTRKLMLMKESAGFVVLPGGFGTLDETFELLTLLQTGKAAPAPLVLLEVPGGTYWKAFERFFTEELAARGMVDPNDQHLFHIADDVEDAANEILGFYRNYHSLRYVGSLLVLRLRAAPAPDELAALNEQFEDIVVEGRIEASGPLSAEVEDDDHLDLARLLLRYDRMSSGRLRAFIDALNRLASAPPLLTLPDSGATTAAGTPPGAAADDAATHVDAEPALAALLAEAASADESAAVRAARALQAVLDAGDMDEAQQHNLVAELCSLVLTAPTPRVRRALLDALAASSPFVGLSLVMELLLDHRDVLDDDAAASLLRALGRMLEVAEAAAPAERSQVALLLRMEEPGPVLDALAASEVDAVAAEARAVRRQINRVAPVLGE